MIGLRPRASTHYLQRRRLLKQLPDVPGYVTWLKAPYGYGKSVLATQWAEQLEKRGWHIIWLTLQGRDPKKILSQQLELPEQAPWGLLLEVLWEEPTLLVLEDLSGGESLSPLLKRVEGLVLLASRRKLPYPELLRLRTAGQLVHLNAGALAFTREEAATRYRLSRKAEDLDELLDLTLVRHRILPGLIPLAELPKERPELATAYPLEEVLASGWKEAVAARHSEIPPLELSVLGDFEAKILGRRVELTSRQREILALLLLQQRREVIGEALWREASTAKVRNNLNVQLNLLRKTIESWGVPTYLFEEGLRRTRADLWRLETALETGSGAEPLPRPLRLRPGSADSLRGQTGTSRTDRRAAPGRGGGDPGESRALPGAAAGTGTTSRGGVAAAAQTAPETRQALRKSASPG